MSHFVDVLPAITPITRLRHACLPAGLIAWTLALIAIPTLQGAPAASPKLRSGDEISVIVLGESTLTGTYRITDDGAIPYPLLGALTASNLSTDELAARIEGLLEADYIRDAHVSVARGARPDASVYVYGEVASPSALPFQAGSGLDLATAIAAVGGLTERADSTRIELKRGETRQFISLASSKELKLQESDTLIVQALGKLPEFEVSGEVKKPGIYTIPRGENLDLLTALTMAGGFSDKAWKSKVTVNRGGSATTLNPTKMRKGGTDIFMVRPGDKINVEESPF